MKTALINASIFTGEEKLDHKALLIEDGHISSITDTSEIPSDFQINNLSGLTIAPALLDLQIYGSGGKLFGALPDPATGRAWPVSADALIVSREGPVSIGAGAHGVAATLDPTQLVEILDARIADVTEPLTPR